MEFEWKPRILKPVAVKRMSRAVSTVHPLKTTSMVSDSTESSHDDPLTQAKSTTTSWGGLDPLSAALSETAVSPDTSPDRKIRTDSSFLEFEDSWQMRKSDILLKYTTSERLSLKSSFISGGSAAGGLVITGVKTHQNTTVAEKVKHRLEQLDEFDESSVKVVGNLTQAEYINRIDDLNSQLNESWKSDQRVKALKIAIQCAKMLTDIHVTQFYPSKFVLVTDILDNFGSLVFTRIDDKFKSSFINTEFAIETCKNWFFKIASIRELIPRFYVEASILKTYKFIVDQESSVAYSKALMRLSKMIRGMGNLLVAAYARSYLCRVALEIAPHDKSFFYANLKDMFKLHNHFSSQVLTDISDEFKITPATYLTVYRPAFDWMMKCLIVSDENVAIEVFKLCKTIKKSRDGEEIRSLDAIILNSIFTSFRPDFLTDRIPESLELIMRFASTECSQFPIHVLIKNFGLSLLNSLRGKVLDDSSKLNTLNEIWKIVALQPVKEYMECSVVWIEIVIKNFTMKEINLILKDITKHLTKDKSFEQHYQELLMIVSKLSNMGDSREILAADGLFPFLNMFQKESVKVDACRELVQSVVCKSPQEELDQISAHSLNSLCRIMNESVNALTLEDEKRTISHLVIEYLRLVNRNKELDDKLNFLIEARADFSNLDSVTEYLVYSANQLAEAERRNQSKKSSAYIRACLAYSFITIPSLDGIVSRLQLYMSSAQVAILSGSLSQTDSFLKTAINQLPNLPASYETGDGRTISYEPFFASYVSHLLSFILWIPDHPDHEPLSFAKALIKVIAGRNFVSDPDLKFFLCLDVLAYLSWARQPTYPHHIENVDSNDKLYGSDEDFLREIDHLSSKMLQTVLDHLTQLTEQKSFKRLTSLSLRLFWRVIEYGDLRQMGKFAFKLWQLAMKHSQSSGLITSSQLDSTGKKVVRLLKRSRADGSQELLERIQRSLDKP